MSKKTKTRKSRSSKSRTPTLAQLTTKIVGKKVSGQEYPGGKSRDSRIMILEDGQRVVATRREDISRIQRECIILKALDKGGVNAPSLLGTNRWNVLIQEEICGDRLSQAFQTEDESSYETLMSSTLTSLADIHETGSENGLDKVLPRIGNTDKWVKELIEHPGRIGHHFDIKPPRPRLDELAQQISIRQPRFVKWDSRPGNGMVTENGDVYWFDWEHAACRNRLDDVAWIMGDEFVPDFPEAEQRLLANHIDRFRDDLSADQAHEYLMAYGTLHQSVRLGLILKTKRDEEWWDLDYCIKGDRVGVTKECATKLCQRASRWAAESETVKSLSPWFLEIAEKIEQLD